jgi:acyl carrier protein
MTRNEIKQKVIEICRDIFDDADLVITEETGASDIDKWDSLAQLNILGDIEDEFNVHFSLDETMSLKTIGELIITIENKII